MQPFAGSSAYWEERYAKGGNSGKGSYGALARFKAAFINKFVLVNNVSGVVELGCGDGNQLGYATYPEYTGYDVSPKAIALCSEAFRGDNTKSFFLMDDNTDVKRADLALSLDVIFHLVEDDVFNQYMQRLFDAGGRFVLIYSSNKPSTLAERSGSAADKTPHVRHRRFSDWVDTHAPHFKCVGRIENGARGNTVNGEKITSPSDFYLYVRSGSIHPADLTLPGIINI